MLIQAQIWVNLSFSHFPQSCQENYAGATETTSNTSESTEKIVNVGEGAEKAMAPHSSTLAWKIPWTEEPGGLQSMGSLTVGHD